MATIRNAKWKLLTHSMSKNGKHKMIAGYTSRGTGGMNTIFFLAPLYNLNDSNMDGSVSYLEWGFGVNLYDPYSIFGLFTDANSACCTIDAARQLRDYDLFNKAKMKFLESAYKAAGKALTTITIERLLSPAIDQALALTNLQAMMRFSDKLIFLVKTGMETAVDEAITRSQRLK